LPAPFDLAAASALARNSDSGDVAEKLFEIDRRRPLHYRIEVTAVSPDQPDLPGREIVNTVAPGARSLASILEILLDELAAHDQD
jgi:hypothetical protein